MPKLDHRGDIAAATIAFYVPVAAVALALTIRYGLRRDAGWIFLFLFSLVRIASGAVLVAAELVTPPNNGLFTAAYILQSAGLSPLLLSTVGFIGLVGQHAFSENPKMSRSMRFIGLLTIIAMALSIAGGVNQNSSKPSNVNTGKTLRRVGAAIFAGVYILLVIVHIASWSYRFVIMRHRQTLLIGISCALPFLGVRVAYGILSAWSAATPKLARFDSVTGDWVLFLVMALVMEYCVALIYMLTGTTIPLRRDRRRARY